MINFNSLQKHQLDNRQLQITSLLQNVISVKEKEKDVYESYWFDQTLQVTLCLKIILPPQFPNIAPVFKIIPTIIHPWVDSQGYIVGHKKSGSNWNQHVSLGNMTNEIIREIQKSNPRIAPQQFSSISSALPQLYYSNTISQPIQPPRPQPQIAHSLSMPQPIIKPTPPQNESYDCSLIDKIDLSDLDKMSNDELKSFLSNDEKCIEYLKNKENIKKMIKTQEEFNENNKIIAEKTLSNKENFEKIKEELISKQEILMTERARFEELMNEQKKYISQYSPEQIISCLQEGTAKADEASEEIANQFLSGEISTEDFLKRFRELRTKYHLRAEKLELLTINQSTIFSEANSL